MTEITAAPHYPTMTTRKLAGIALAGLAWFVAGVALLHVLRPDLTPASHMISEYAVGQLGWIQTLNFLALATGTAALFLAARRGPIPLGTVAKSLVGAFSVTTYLSAVFETGSGTWQAQVHELVGVLGFLALMVAAFTAARSLRGSAWARLRRWSLLWGAAMVVTFPLVPLLGEAGMGIGQRLFIACALGWLATIAATLRNALREPSEQTQRD